MEKNKKVNLIELFRALGYEKDTTCKTQKTVFLKKSMGYDEDVAKTTLEADKDVADQIVAKFIANVETDAQKKRSDLAKEIDLTDDKFYVATVAKTADDIVKTLKAEVARLKKEIVELKAELELALADDVDEEDADDIEDEDGEEDEEA